MPSYDPKHVARRFDDEVLNAGNLLAADEVLAADYVDRGMPEGWPRGVDGFRQFLQDGDRHISRRPCDRRGHDHRGRQGRGPAGVMWEVKVIAVTGRYALSLRRRLGRNIIYPNEVVEKNFRIPATTRSWNTIQAICRILERFQPEHIAGPARSTRTR